MKRGKPLLNKELDVLENGSWVWVVYERDGVKEINEALKIHRREPGGKRFDLYGHDEYQGYGEDFVSDYDGTPDGHAGHDVHDGMFLYHVKE